MSKTLILLRSLGPVDLKMVARDSMLLLVTVGSLLLALIIRLGIPILAPLLQTQFGLDLVPFYPLIMSLVVLMAPGMAGAVVGFLLLDERDDRTLTALLVTPIPLTAYVLYRLGVPILLALLVTPLVVSIAGLVTIPFAALLLVSVLASLSGATTALLLASFAQNKVTGVAVMKMLNGVQALPMVAFFIQPPAQWLAGIVPSYWALAVYWRMAAGVSYWGYWLVGVIVNAAFLVWLMLRYNRNLRQ